MAQPKISVLIPIYNVEKYLEECLSSICAQSFRDLEIICINDGSTDSSKSIVEQFQKQDTRIKLIDKPNSGYGASMNKGLQAATGKYVTILESDDFLDPFAYQTMFEAMEKYDAQVVKCNYFHYWSQPTAHKIFFETIAIYHSGRLVNPQIERFSQGYPPAIWAALFDRQFLLDNDIWFLETPGAAFQDISFSFKIQVSATKMVFLYDAFVNYRQDNEQSSVKSMDKVFFVCDEHAEMEDYLNKRPEREYLREYFTAKKLLNYIWNYRRISDELKPVFFERMVTEFKEIQDAGHLDSQAIPYDIRQEAIMILKDPELYNAQKTNQSESTMQSIRHYLRIGGLSLATRAIFSKQK
jgi:glycosyltransferase involved in cell wall biosynthesis